MPDNVVKGTSGVDSLYGTAGRDLIYGYGGNDTMYGGDGNDMIYAGDGNDTLYGGDGDDGLVGGGGGDTMYGGKGNDTYYVNSAQDRVIEISDEGLDTVVSSLANYRIGANVERLYLAENAALDSAGRSNATGNELDNRIKGNSGSNAIHGNEGNDELYGYGGNDFINGGIGDDIMVGGDGIDTVTFKDGATNGVYVNLTITARYDTGMGKDVIREFENIEGTNFSDTLIGDAGANKIITLGGGDSVRGGGGDDEIILGSGADSVFFDSAATNGVDKIRAFESGVDKLYFRIADGYDANAQFSLDAASGTGAQFVYNTKTQQLFYDADGAGGNAAVLLAFMGENPPLVLAGTDIVLI